MYYMWNNAPSTRRTSTFGLAIEQNGGNSMIGDIIGEEKDKVQHFNELADKEAEMNELIMYQMEIEAEEDNECDFWTI